ncbi:hypothetical protein LINGRAHAP2_LOCUS8844 [Linum grandiflorum]
MKYRDLCRHQREVHLSHIYREANCAADYLANLCQFYSYDLHLGVIL